jgi:hypothetical protein
VKQSLLLLAVLSISAGCVFPPQPRPYHVAYAIADRSFRLVKFTGPSGTATVPDGDKTKYTVAFAKDGKVQVRFDCESGGGTWAVAGPNQLVFGPLKLSRLFGATQGTCSPEGLHDQLVRHWPLVRSFRAESGEWLFLSLLDDGGTYQFEIIRPDWGIPVPVSH